MNKFSLTLILAATIQTIAIPTLALGDDTHPAYKPASFSIKNNSKYTLRYDRYEFSGQDNYNAQVPGLDETLPKTLEAGKEGKFDIDIDRAFKQRHELIIRYCYTSSTSVPRIDDCCDFLILFNSYYENKGYNISVTPPPWSSENKYISCGAQAGNEKDALNHFTVN